MTNRDNAKRETEMTRSTTTWLVMVTMTCLAMPALAGTDKTCLTGTDPAVRNDAAQIAAVEAAIDEVCPCVSDDTGHRAMHRDYLRCAAARVKAAVKVGTPHAFYASGPTPVRWLQMAAPQPRPAGAEPDTFFLKDRAVPT